MPQQLDVFEQTSEQGYNTDHGDITRISVAPEVQVATAVEKPVSKKSKSSEEPPADALIEVPPEQK